MNHLSWKRLALPLLLAIAIVSLGCSKKVAAPPPPPPPPPVVVPPPAPTVSLSVDRAAITAGQSAILSYTSTNAATVTISGGVGAVQPAAAGTRTVTPNATTSFTATATGPGGTANSAAVTVTVNPVPPPPPVVTPPAPRVAPPPAPGPTVDQLFMQTMVPVLFDYDKYDIRQDQESKLLNIAAWLKQNVALRFTIEGHADERGSQEYNIALSDERANSVLKYLSGQGIAETRMTTVPYGEERPVCREQDENCWQRNRRAAFVRIP